MNVEKLIKVLHAVKAKDSNKLKQMAYKFAQMGNYFDRANSAQSRSILAKEDDKKYPEFYSYALQVYQQLKNEVEGMKKASPTAKPYSYVFDNETLKLLIDGTNRLYWAAEDRRDKKGEILSKKINAFVKEYKNTAYDSVKDAIFEFKFDDTLGEYHVVKLSAITEDEATRRLKKQFNVYKLHSVKKIHDSDQLEKDIANCKIQALDFTKSMTNTEEQKIYKQLYNQVLSICSKAENEINSAKNENKNPAKESIIDKLYQLDIFLMQQSKTAKNSSAKSKLEALAKELHRCWDRNRKY